MKLPNIDHKKSKTNPTIDSPSAEFELPFYKDVDYFISLDNFVSFIKATEKLVRTSEEYKAYKDTVMNEYGLNKCQVLSNIEADEDNTVKLEMHHGPILTLFDVTSIILDWMIARDMKITTFSVAKIVLDEHFLNNVQVTMLSESIHQLVHDDEVFLSLQQAFGDLNKFLTKYRDGLNISHIKNINRYIEKSKEQGAHDTGVLDLQKTVLDWRKDYGDEYDEFINSI